MATVINFDELVFLVPSFVPHQGVVQKIVERFASTHVLRLRGRKFHNLSKTYGVMSSKLVFCTMNLNVVIKLFDMFTNILQLYYGNTTTDIWAMKFRYDITLSIEV